VRIQKGVLPACVLACPAGARYFGDLDDPNSEVSHLVVLKKAKQIRPDLRTGPNIFYVR
jgi:Fe-S-cluster-containing dehydrogenase component